MNTLPVLKYNASRRGGKLVLSEPFDSRDVGINTRLADTVFLEEINRILAELKKDGFLDKLDEKWFK